MRTVAPSKSKLKLVLMGILTITLLSSASAALRSSGASAHSPELKRDLRAEKEKNSDVESGNSSYAPSMQHTTAHPTPTDGTWSGPPTITGVTAAPTESPILNDSTFAPSRAPTTIAVTTAAPTMAVNQTLPPSPVAPVPTMSDTAAPTFEIPPSVPTMSDTAAPTVEIAPSVPTMSDSLAPTVDIPPTVPTMSDTAAPTGEIPSPSPIASTVAPFPIPVNQTLPPTKGIEIPANWTCPTFRYYDKSVCDCECGVYDPDCDNWHLRTTCHVSHLWQATCDRAKDECSLDQPTHNPTMFPTSPTPGPTMTPTNSPQAAAPSVWTCRPSYYKARDGCDCGCGDYDPDCDGPGALYCNGGSGNYCDEDSGSCVFDETRTRHPSASPTSRIPASWICSEFYYDAYDGCDCGCGAYDPDCDKPGQSVLGCTGNQVCSKETAECVDQGTAEPTPSPGNEQPPSSWTCFESYFSDEDGCDCGCGAYDPDCDDSSQMVYCNGGSGNRCDAATATCYWAPTPAPTHMPSTAPPPPTPYPFRQIPPRNWTCGKSTYGDGERCDCGCGAYDIDCEDESSQFLCRNGNGNTCDKSGECIQVAPTSSPTGQRSLPPADWTCAQGFYYDKSTCSCGCGAYDPDCDNPDHQVECNDASSGDFCNPTTYTCQDSPTPAPTGYPTYPSPPTTMAPSPSPAPTDWKCPESWYSALDGCDCGCGSFDPDCDIPWTGLYCFGESGGNTCDPDTAQCIVTTGTPTTTPTSSPTVLGWTCEPGRYADGYFCDCECGVYDPDCDEPFAWPECRGGGHGSICDKDTVQCVDPACPSKTQEDTCNDGKYCNWIDLNNEWFEDLNSSYPMNNSAIQNLFSLLESANNICTERSLTFNLHCSVLDQESCEAAIRTGSCSSRSIFSYPAFEHFATFEAPNMYCYPKLSDDCDSDLCPFGCHQTDSFECQEWLSLNYSECSTTPVESCLEPQCTIVNGTCEESCANLVESNCTERSMCQWLQTTNGDGWCSNVVSFEAGDCEKLPQQSCSSALIDTVALGIESGYVPACKWNATISRCQPLSLRDLYLSLYLRAFP